MAIPSLVAAGTSIVGGLLGSSASKKVAEQQAAAAAAAEGKVSSAVQAGQKAEGESVAVANDQLKEGVTGANQTLSDVFAGQKENLNPYLQAGAQGTTSLADMFKNGGEQFSFSPTDLQKTPGYQFQLEQGTEALKRQANATGAGGGGGTLAALMKYGQGLAGTTYNDAYNRALGTFQTNRQNTMQGLMALTGIGQTATGQYNQAAQNFGDTTSTNMMQGGMGQASNTMRASEFGSNLGMQGATSIADLMTQAGEAKAAGTVGSANAWNSALSGVGNAASAYGQNKTLAGMFSGYGGGGGVGNVEVPMIGGQPWGGGGYSPGDYSEGGGAGTGSGGGSSQPSAPQGVAPWTSLPAWMTPATTATPWQLPNWADGKF
jgi:hypothetical protein